MLPYGMAFVRLPSLISRLHSFLGPETRAGALGLCHATLPTSQPSNSPHKVEEKFEGLSPRLKSVLNSIQNIDKRNFSHEESRDGGIGFSRKCEQRTQLEICHPWQEWIEMVDRLVQGNYLNKEEGIDDVVDHVRSGSEEDVKVLKALRNACLRFGRDRFDILRSLSRRDIHVIVGSGCPSLDGKVVTSAKRLRKHVHLDEGNVCSACNLRASCERAYIVPRREDSAHTIDVMRILMTYAYYPLIGSYENELSTSKTVKASVRKLLKQVIKLSAIPLDPNLPKPIFVRPSKVKQIQPPKWKNKGRDDIEKKRGDWLCPRCDFINFAKNNVCLQCDEIRPKPKLNLGEWECPGCGFVNYRRNLACYKCECNRPQREYINSTIEKTQQLTYREWKWQNPFHREDSPEPSHHDSNGVGCNGSHTAR